MKKDPKNDPKRDRKILPLSGRLKIFHLRLSTSFKNFSPPKICTTKKVFFFTARLCCSRGSHANKNHVLEGSKGHTQEGYRLGVQSWSPFVTRKSGHIWRIWAEMTQTLMPKSTKVAQIHLPECDSAKFPPKFAKFARKIRQILPNLPPTFTELANTKGL